MLSLSSSAVFLLSFAVTIYAFTDRTKSPLFSFLVEHWIPLVFVPALLPCLALVRLAHLRFLRQSDIPFFDGWFIHLAILLPYVLLLAIA